jgi:sporulation protein YlmC with PRC-barrel domain
MMCSLRAFVLMICVMATGAALAEDNASALRTGAAKSATKSLPKLPVYLNRASQLIGMDVDDQRGNKIGEIKDIVLDPRQGQIAYAVVGFGSVMGVGSKYFAIPWKKLQPGTDEHYVLQVEKETLKRTPGFDKDHWPDMASTQWNSENDRFYKQSPYWRRDGAEPLIGQVSHVNNGGTSSGSAGAMQESSGGGMSEF